MLDSSFGPNLAAGTPLTPIKVSILESWRLISLSYSDPLEHTQFLSQKYGNVVMQKVGKMKVVHLFGADANRLSLLNPDNILSNKKAWDQIEKQLQASIPPEQASNQIFKQILKAKSGTYFGGSWFHSWFLPKVFRVLPTNLKNFFIRSWYS